MPSYTAPGVYIEEIPKFPNSVVPVPTAIPAFIGYTPKAEHLGKSVYFKPQRINSLLEFEQIFLLPTPAQAVDSAKQYSPNYYVEPQSKKSTAPNCLDIAGATYAILPDPSTIYYLYNSVRLFYQNGVGAAYIVSVGKYGPVKKKSLAGPTKQIVNPNVKLTHLKKGLAALKKEQEPTIYVCPDATLLSVANNKSLMQAMLQQAEAMQTAFCVFDVIGGDKPDSFGYSTDIQTFRDSVGVNSLKYGACYYPFVCTNIMQSGELDFTNFFGGDITKLQSLLAPSPNSPASQVLLAIQNPPANPLSNSQQQAALLAVSPLYKTIFDLTLKSANILPACGAIAGVYKSVDDSRGVWKAPANVSLNNVVGLPIQLTDQQQDSLNVDSSAGKSINAIRSFAGKGILIWGSRTLAGNDNEWRYVPVRRTITFIEQSIKQSLQTYVFEPNDANTWVKVRATIENFLTNLWRQGAFQGAKPEHAFFVSVGLGNTMTADDILNGMMRIQIGVAIVRPAEFIITSISQKMVSA